jgi:hypothetical protein
MKVLEYYWNLKHVFSKSYMMAKQIEDQYQLMRMEECVFTGQQFFLKEDEDDEIQNSSSLAQSVVQ